MAKTTDRITRHSTRVKLKDRTRVKVKFGFSAPCSLTFYSLPRILKAVFLFKITTIGEPLLLFIYLFIFFFGGGGGLRFRVLRSSFWFLRGLRSSVFAFRVFVFFINS